MHSLILYKETIKPIVSKAILLTDMNRPRNDHETNFGPGRSQLS